MADANDRSIRLLLGKTRPKFSAEWINKMSIAKKGKPSPKKGKKCKPLTEEHKAKISKSLKEYRNKK